MPRPTTNALLTPGRSHTLTHTHQPLSSLCTDHGGSVVAFRDPFRRRDALAMGAVPLAPADATLLRLVGLRGAVVTLAAALGRVGLHVTAETPPSQWSELPPSHHQPASGGNSHAHARVEGERALSPESDGDVWSCCCCVEGECVSDQESTVR